MEIVISGSSIGVVVALTAMGNTMPPDGAIHGALNVASARDEVVEIICECQFMWGSCLPQLPVRCFKEVFAEREFVES